MVRSFVLARITKPDNLSSAEFIAVLSGAPQTTPAAKAFMQAMKHMTSLFGGDGGGGGTDTEHFHGIQLYTRDLTFAEFCNLRNQLLRAQISGDLTQQAAIEVIQPSQGPPTSTDQPRELKEADSEEIEDVPRPRPVLPTQPEAPGDSRNWCEKIQITLHQIREDAQEARERGDMSIGRAWIDNKTRQFLKSVNVNLVQLYGMPLLQEAGITPTTPDFFNSLPIGNVGDGDESQIGMTMNNCKKLQRFLEENPDRAPAGVVWPERPNPEDSPLVRPDPVAPSQDMIDAQVRRKRIWRG